MLGSLRVDGDKGSVPVHGKSLRRILAALLARPGRPVAVGELVDLLWGDDPPRNAVRNVRSYVAKLKRTLEGLAPNPIESGPSGYTLRIRAGELDSVDFTDTVRRAVGAQRAGEYTTANLLFDRALRMWQGDPFADIDESMFLRPEIERLRQCHLEALELGLELGRGAELIPDLGRIVEQHPYQERPIALLMRALSVAGRQAEAQQVFRETRHRLVQDLGVDPSADLTELHEALLRGERIGTNPPSTGPAEPLPAAAIVDQTPLFDQRGQADNEDSEESGDGQAAGLVAVDHMPQPPRVLQPRKAYLRQLELIEQRNHPSVTTVTGPRGVGKTQLVAAYARTRMANGAAVFWVNAGTREGTVAGLAEVAAVAQRNRADNRGSGQELRLNTAEDAEQAARQARRWLSSLRTPALLVFDDARDPETVREWLPRFGPVQVVITSNRRVFGWLGDNMDLTPFDRAEAIAFLYSATGLPADDATERILDEIGQYALALALAGAVISTERLSYRDYLRRLEKLPARRSLAAYEGDPYPHGVVEAIRLSLDAVQDTNGARALAEQIAVLAPAGTDRAMLVPDVLDEHGRADRSRALAVLVDAYLAHYAEDGRLIVMHPLTRRVLLELCTEQGRLDELLRSVSSMLDDHLQRAAAAGDTYVSQQQALDHLDSLLAILSRAEPGVGARTEVLALCTSVVGNFHNRCDFVRVAPLNTRVHEEQRKLLGADDPVTLRSCTKLAMQYRRLAKLDQAVDLLDEILQRQRSRLGEEHADTLWTRNTLAATYLVSGRADRAITMLRELVADRGGNQNVQAKLAATRRLGWALRSVGQLEEAEEIYRSIMPEYERVCGPEHPQTFRTRSEFACVHRHAGKLDTAEALLTDLIAVRERTLGRDHPDHPDLYHDLERLADVRRATGAPEEAREIFERAAVHWTETLGDRHPWTLISRNNVACAVESIGDLDTAYAMFVELHDLHDEVLGPALPRSLNVAHNHASVLVRRGDHRDAIAMFSDVLAGRRHSLGEQHPDTQATRRSFGLVRARFGQDDQNADSVCSQTASPDWQEPLPRWLRDGSAYGSGHSVDSTIRLSVHDLG